MPPLPAPVPLHPIATALPAQADSDARLIAIWLHGRTPGTVRAYAGDVRAFLAHWRQIASRGDGR